MARWLKRIGWLCVALYVSLIGLGAWRVNAGYDEELAAPFASHGAPWATSERCRSCHPDHHASWWETFHRTMTQEADEESVVGAFDGRTVTFFDVPARPVRRDGKYLIEYLSQDGREVLRTLEIARTVGSRRYQQYLVQDPEDPADNYYRIPLLWHIGEARWIHLNGAFLGPDDPNYDKHVALWNDNCIFCHNTGPQPGLANYEELVERRMIGENVNISSHGRFESEVAELGIACESCHGPAGEHIARNRDPFRRYALHLFGAADPTIVDPERLDQERSVEVCGQCHGQRMPKRDEEIVGWMHDGPPYRAGESLASLIRRIERDTPVPRGQASDGFSLRFWEDGTPRLTAYEYQGVLASPCYREGDLTCLSCHTMHGGDVFGQLPPENRTNAACLACHTEIADDVPAHTHHEAESSGSACYECHMPKAVYGVLAIHRSHRIENPDPARDAEAGRPNACTSCHVDRSPAWAAKEMAAWWGEAYREPERRGDGAPTELAGVIAALHAGDPVQRSVAAERMGRDDTPLSAHERAFLVPHLLFALFDRYPAVRWFARRSLVSLGSELAEAGVATGLADEAALFDYLADPAAREAAARSMLEAWTRSRPADLPEPPEGSLLDAEHRPDMDEVLRLVRMQSTKLIQIGE
ncbi:MAG: cytochrome c3 family protein [Planctomycetota bacterium]